MTAPQSTTIASLKEEVLSALSSDANQVEDVLNVVTVADFEICKGVKEKGRVVRYEILEGSEDVKEAKLVNWEVLFLQFRDESGKYDIFMNLPSPFHFTR